MNRLRYQGLINFVKTIEDPVNFQRNDFQAVEFKTKKLVNEYVNFKSIYICFPKKVKKQN